MARCRFWHAYQIGDDSRYSFKLHGQFSDSIRKGDKIIEDFDGRQVVYKVVTVDHDAKIYGVDYLDEL